MLWIGPPGCGKTSLAEAIAYKYRCATYTFPLGESTLTDSELMIMYLQMGPKAIALYDDVDRVMMGEKRITENGLFKLLDGFARQDQTLLNILICNDETKVPPALRRKGRVDKEYYFSLASRAQVKEIFLLCNVWKAEETRGLDLNAMAEEFAKGVPDNSVPPANIAVYIKEAKTPKEAVEHVQELTAKIGNDVEQKREERRVNTVRTRIWEQG
jgi:SpoVK/Ycf46/Vps4 family AAA+-type ATPase